ncbi:MAG: response regulator [Deltaproteobacteria bacterium]|jgi:adenylate cyclase|nr:response regulator [Deltaproteobacteria bacterium]
MGDRKEILIVDDEPDILMVLGKRLAGAGYDVIKARSGAEALRLAKTSRPDLIILDLMMPEMSGQETAERLRSDPKLLEVPIIFLTALFTKRDEKSLGHDVAGNTFFAKPYDPEKLLAEIRRILSL